jgi:cytochrome c
MSRKNRVAVAAELAAVLIGLFLLGRVHPLGDAALFSGERRTDIARAGLLARNLRAVQPGPAVLHRSKWPGAPMGFPDAANSHGSGDAVRGRAVFEKRCTGCHALTQNREGPRLNDVFGRRAASVAGFNYSEALKKMDVRWNRETLNRWLTDPDAMAPGTDMTFRVIRAVERADVIEYLRQQAGR